MNRLWLLYQSVHIDHDADAEFKCHCFLRVIAE